MKPYIIVIEGTDGCGKQTQTQKLYDWLNSCRVNVVRQSFPNYDSPSASPVKMYLNGELGTNANDINAYQASTLYAVDRFCTMKKLEQEHPDAEVILFDRYVESNMLHQAGKIADIEERNVYLEWLDNLEFGTLQLPRADKVFFLDLPVEKSLELAHNRKNLKAGTKKDIHEQNPDHLLNAYNAGKYVAKKFGWTIVDCLDSNGNIKSIDDIHNIIKTECSSAIVKNVVSEQKNECGKKAISHNPNVKL